MFAQSTLDNANPEVINQAGEQSTALMRQIFEALSEGVIKFSWKQSDGAEQLIACDHAICQHDKNMCSLSN
jgi:hypothetical protein